MVVAKRQCVVLAAKGRIDHARMVPEYLRIEFAPDQLGEPRRRAAASGLQRSRMAQGLRGADVVVMLRLQSERMGGATLPSAGEFFKHYGLTAEKLALAKADAIVMHPGPMNRGVEIESAVADGSHSVILPQVTFGIAVRMAVMSILAGS